MNLFFRLFFRFFESRFWALVLKEIRQILKSKQLIFLLVRMLTN
jgi:ABC-2 type transport system permease protein